jgi:hypothetical protein
MTMTAAMGIVLFSRSCTSSSVNGRLSLAVALFNLCMNINFFAGRNRTAPRVIDEIQYQIVIASMTKNSSLPAQPVENKGDT